MIVEEWGRVGFQEGMVRREEVTFWREKRGGGLKRLLREKDNGTQGSGQGREGAGE